MNPYYNPYANSEYNKRVSIGGNIKVEGSLQLIFRLPFIEDQRSMRSAFFFDFGNVFSDNCKDYQINCYKPSIDDLKIFIWSWYNLDNWLWSNEFCYIQTYKCWSI